MTSTVEHEPARSNTAPQRFDEIRRDLVVNSAGVRYKEFKQKLAPKFWLVWAHLAAAYMVLLAITAGVVLVLWNAPGLTFLAIFAAGLLYGYTLAFIQLFLHEAAHFNIARDRAMNDRLANICIGAIVGQDIRMYRPIHFDHHRYLGTPQDTEHTYFDPLNIRFIAEALLGIKPLKVLTRREKIARDKGGATAKGVLNAQLLVGLVLNAIFVIGAVALGYWSIAVAWVIAMVIFFPFFASVRQLLEHRDEEAKGDIDYTQVPHGMVNRMFGAGPLASTLGGAGFNRHLLHHWEPQISYTRLADLERFLMDTELADLLNRHRTSYGQTFVRLFNH